MSQWSHENPEEATEIARLPPRLRLAAERSAMSDPLGMADEQRKSARERTISELIRCPQNGKVIYWTAKAANKAITEAQRRGELSTLRHYPCPHGEHWHLSRKRGTDA